MPGRKPLQPGPGRWAGGWEPAQETAREALMRSEKREKKPAPSLQRQQKQQLFERKKKRGREGKDQKGARRTSVCRGEGSRDQ